MNIKPTRHRFGFSLAWDWQYWLLSRIMQLCFWLLRDWWMLKGDLIVLGGGTFQLLLVGGRLTMSSVPKHGEGGQYLFCVHAATDSFILRMIIPFPVTYIFPFFDQLMLFIYIWKILLNISIHASHKWMNVGVDYVQGRGVIIFQAIWNSLSWSTDS